MSKNKLCVIMFSMLFNTCNCLYIDNMSSTSRLGLKPSKPIIYTRPTIYINNIIYTNTPPQTQGGDEEAILSLDTRSRKRPGG